MQLQEYMKITNNLNRLKTEKLITEAEYMRACDILDKKFIRLKTE